MTRRPPSSPLFPYPPLFRSPVLPLVETPPQSPSVAQEQPIDPPVARRLDDLLGFGRRLAAVAEQAFETAQRVDAQPLLAWREDRPGLPVQIPLRHRVGEFENAV